MTNDNEARRQVGCDGHEHERSLYCNNKVDDVETIPSGNMSVLVWKIYSKANFSFPGPLHSTVDYSTAHVTKRT